MQNQLDLFWEGATLSFFSILSLHDIADNKLRSRPPHFLSEKNLE